MLDGVLWLLRSGAPWRDMPECFGPWRTVYHRFVAYVVSSGALKNLGPVLEKRHLAYRPAEHPLAG